MLGKLALYSDQVPPHTDPADEHLKSWLSKGAKVGYLPSSPDPERSWFRSRQAYYERLGFELRFFGLEDEFDVSSLPDLWSCEAIHLTGGNTYRFLYWLKERQMLAGLRRYVEGGGVLIGVSAGAILMTPNTLTSSLCGDIPYPGLTDYGGLALVDFAVVPHFDGSEAGQRAILEFAGGFDGPVLAIPDGSAVLVDGGRNEFIGEVWVAKA